MYPGKRAFDVFFSCAGLLVFLPIWLLCALLMLLIDRGPFVFAQTRVGKNKQPFTVYKIRTMKQSGEVSELGRWLRATGIDESLQFISVLFGDMSIVGPRPITASDLLKLGWEGPHLSWRWRCKPGITGPAQIFEPLATRRSLARDRLYIRHASLHSDLCALMLSFGVNIFGKQVIRSLLKRWSAN